MSLFDLFVPETRSFPGKLNARAQATNYRRLFLLIVFDFIIGSDFCKEASCWNGFRDIFSSLMKVLVMPHAAHATAIARAPLKSVVNVSSVPQRSPFRYPGGKTWLVPLVRQWLRSLPRKPALLVEPFAGGAIVGLTAGFENLATKVLLVELDQDVASVWDTVLSRDASKLASRIRKFQFSKTSVASALATPPRTRLDRAFQTILRNRVQHGGIIAPGASLMKLGENGNGLKSR